MEQPDFFAEAAHLIAVRVTPHDGGYALFVNSTNPDREWTSRALRIAADLMLIGDTGPAVTVSGQPVDVIALPGTTPEGARP